MKGMTGENLMTMLEARLDSVVSVWASQEPEEKQDRLLTTSTFW